MYRDLYNTPTIEVSIIQILLIAITVLVAFVIPAEYISKLQSGDTGTTPYTADALQSRKHQTGRVAGVSDGESASSTAEARIRIPLTNYYINLGSEAGALTIGGTILIGIGLILVVYLLLSSNKKPKRDIDDIAF